MVRGLGLLGVPAPLWCGVVQRFGVWVWSPSLRAHVVWCGVVRGSGRPGCLEIVVVIIIIIIIIIIVIIIVIVIVILIVILIGILIITIIIIIIIMMFLSGVNCHRKWARQERLRATVAFSIPSWQSPGWTVSIVTRIGHVWDEIFVTVDGFGAAM